MISVSVAVSERELAAIRPLVQAHIEYERSDAVMPADWHDRAARLVAAGRLTIFVARSDADAVGYASVSTEVGTWAANSFAHLDCLFIADGHRGAGIGRALFDAVSAEARRQGLSDLQWQTPHWNAGAIRFYESIGATSKDKKRFSLALAR
jgi:GNAT superfamily N-acetyltransferase